MIGTTSYTYLGKLKGNLVFKHNDTGNLKLFEDVSTLKQRERKEAKKKLDEVKHGSFAITGKALKVVANLSSTYGKAFIIIVKLMNWQNNILHLSQKQLSKKMGISYTELKRYIKELKQDKLIKTGICKIYINPIISCGSTYHRIALYEHYNRLPIDPKHKK